MFEKTKKKINESIEKVKQADVKNMAVKTAKAGVITVAAIAAGDLIYKAGRSTGGKDFARGLTAYYQEHPVETVEALGTWVEKDIYNTHCLTEKDKQYLKDNLDKIYAE